MNKAVILDRDGTVLKDCHYLSDPDQIQLYKGVIPALKKLKKNGWKVIIGTNQSGIGRGYFTLDTLKKIHDRLEGIFEKNGLKIDEIFYCPHRPDENCHCRKPRIGMLETAAKKYNLDLKKSVVVGDKECDILWGQSADSKTILVLTGYGKKTVKKSLVKADHTSRTLTTAVEWILRRGKDQ